MSLRAPFPAVGVLAVIALLSFGAVGAALFTQYQWDMQPCPWCVLQRLIFVAIGVVALIALAWRARGARIALAVVLMLLAASGMAAALWQHFVAAASASCNLTLADRIVAGLQLDALLPAVFQATASCAEAATKLAGLPYEFWSLALFALIDTAALLVLLRTPAIARR